jgi:hypothetical protein
MKNPDLFDYTFYPIREFVFCRNPRQSELIRKSKSLSDIFREICYFVHKSNDYFNPCVNPGFFLGQD